MDWVLSPIHYMIISKLKFCSELCYLRPILTTLGLFWRIISNSYRYYYLFSPTLEKGNLWICGHPTLFSKYWDFFLLSAVILLWTFVGNAYSVFSSLPLFEMCMVGVRDHSKFLCRISFGGTQEENGRLYSLHVPVVG